jgi:hypothetical protein
VPLVLSVSAREPASIHTPTVDVCAHGECSVAIYLSSADALMAPSSVISYRQSIGQCGGFCLHAIFYDGCRESSPQWGDSVESRTIAQSLGEVES